MSLSKKLLASLNAQITMELAASHQYLATAAWFEAESLPGMAHWMQMQSAEERAHALRFFQFVVDRDEDVVLGAIDAPATMYASSLEAFSAALASEQAVTASIKRLYAQASEEGDFEAIPLLNWFINEQVEEEAIVDQVIEDLRRIGDDSQALLLLDRELGARQAEQA